MRRICIILLTIVFLASLVHADNILTTTGQTDKLVLDSSGKSIFDALLDEATGDEAALTINYETNKATSGDDIGLQINRTDTATPGTSDFLRFQNVGAPDPIFRIDDTGNLRAGSNFTIQTYSSGVGTPTIYGNTQGWTVSGKSTQSATATGMTLIPAASAWTNTSGQATGLKINSIYNQASGTAANTDFLINRTETAIGSGTQYLIDAQVGGTSKFNIDNDGLVVIDTGKVGSASSPSIALGDGDTGLFEAVDDRLDFTLGGTGRFIMTNSAFQGTTAGAASLKNAASTSVIPSIVPRTDDSGLDTGIGSGGEDQLSLIAGGLEMIRAVQTGVSTTDQVIIGPAGVIGTNTTPSLAFGDGDTGLYEIADDQLGITLNGGIRWTFSTSFMQGNSSYGAQLYTGSASNTVPAHTFVNDADTGLGGGTQDQLSLIAGAKEMIRVVETGVATTDQVIISPGAISGTTGTPALAFSDGDTGFYESIDDALALKATSFALNISNGWVVNSNGISGVLSNRPALSDSAVSGTNPTVRPRSGDVDSGIGSAADDQTSIIAGGKEFIRVVETGVATTDQVIISPGVISGTSGTPALAFGDGDTGFYESSDDNIVFASGGGADWIFSGSVIQSFISTHPYMRQNGGSVSAPAYSFVNDTDSGIHNSAADQVSLIAGAKEMVRISETGTASTDQVIISPGVVSGAAGTPSLAFGDGDSGIRESSDDALVVNATSISFSITNGWNLNSAGFGSVLSNQPLLRDSAASSISPNICPRSGDTDTGIGSAAVDQLSIISGGKEFMRIVETGTATSDQIIFSPSAALGAQATPALAFGDGDSGFYQASDDIIGVSIAGSAKFLYSGSQFAANASDGPAMINVASTATLPGFVFSADTDTGVGHAAADALSITAGGVEGIRVTNSAGAITTQNNGVLTVTGALNAAKVTADPCGANGYVEGAIFYNDTSDYMCFCDAVPTAKQMHSPATNCF